MRNGFPLALGMLVANYGYGQPVTQHIQYEHPARTVTHDVSLLKSSSKARVAVVRSNQTKDHVAGGERLVDEAVYNWELFLSGLQIPYVVLDDADLNRGISRKLLVLVLPAVESISETQSSHILDFLRDGGGIIASGKTGFHDEHGWRGKGEFLNAAFGVDYQESVPVQPYGLFQTIDSRSPLSAGIPPGFRLNLAPRLPTSAVTEGSAISLGSINTYEESDQAHFDDLTMIASGSYGKGRFVWTQFLPQDISRKPSQQENYQRLMINALAHVSRSPTVSVARWPEGKPMALTVAVLSSPGFDALTYLSNLGHFLTLIEETSTRASFYFASDEITTFPTLYRRVIESGSEIGITADNDDLLIDSALKIQTDRLTSAVRALRLSQAHGVYPPGGFLDGNTIRALETVGAAYVIGADASSRVPGHLDWWDFVDFRDSFRREQPRVSGPAQDYYQSGEMREQPDISTIPLASSFGIEYETAYDDFKEGGGHLVLPFYPEQFGPDSKASENLRRTLEKATIDNTWVATASDALIWWRTRENLRLRLIPSGRNELHIVLENPLEHSVSGVVLEIYLRQRIPSSIRVSSPAYFLPVDERVADAPDAAESIRIYIPEVQPGQNRIEISWQR